MAKAKTVAGGLQVSEDRAWQEKFWTAQRIAWVLMTLFILAALAGLTGKGGPFASATARTSGASIDYPKITRWQSQEQVTVRLPPAASGKADLILSPAFGELFTVDSVVPEPSSSRSTAEGQHYTFDVAPSQGVKSISFHVTTAKPVIAQPLEMRIGDSPPLRMQVTILP